MAKLKYDLTGKIFTRLTVLDYRGCSTWRCQCACGTIKDVSATDLMKEKVRSCGCLQKELVSARTKLEVAAGSEISSKYGVVTILRELDQIGQFRMFECRCFCGGIFSTRLNSLRTGITKSCGCIVKTGNNKTHGMTGTLTYLRWKAMITRATNPNINTAHNYSGRGITVCDRWRIFENFLEDMGEITDSNLTLDRTDNDGSYCKENCRWVTQKVQTRNKRRGDHVAGISVLPSGNYRVLINTDTQTNKHVGVYKTYEEAREARLNAEKQYWNTERKEDENDENDEEA